MEVPAPQWTRDTTWRQGHVLPAEAVQALGLLHPSVPDATCVVVVSHDCDLANADLAVEPDVEVIVGCHPAKPDGNFQWAKTPRTLHLEITKAGTPVLVELVATSKRAVSKTALAAFSQDAAYSLSGQGLAVLRSWMAVRYNRAAFPDPFVKRMAKFKVDKALAKLVEPQGALVSAIFFDVDGGRELDRSDDSPYELVSCWPMRLAQTQTRPQTRWKLSRPPLRSCSSRSTSTRRPGNGKTSRSRAACRSPRTTCR